MVYSGPTRWVLAGSGWANGQLSSSLERYHAVGFSTSSAEGTVLWGGVTVDGSVQPPPKSSITAN